MHRLIAPTGIVVIALALAACPRDRLGQKACAVDSDCGTPAEAFRCEATTGQCFCRTDQACPGAQFCNPGGYCQDRQGCERNEDCLAANLICDSASGTCVAPGRCSSDLQCALGEICDVAKSRCVTGCHKNGDCPGSSCRCGDVACVCNGTTPEEIAKCQIGECDQNFCADESFCRYGEICGVMPDAGPRAQCANDYDNEVRPYCARCTYAPGVETCGRGPNYCIIDTRTNSTYCGADCSAGQLCPRGYGCRDIRIVYTRWMCSGAQAACPGNGNFPCTQDSECTRGGACVKANGAATGFCSGRCFVREGSSFGYCSCLEDADCPQQQCSQGECSVSRHKCVVDADCRAIRCVDFDGIGACLIGQNCTPSNGLTCVEVQQ